MRGGGCAGDALNLGGRLGHYADGTASPRALAKPHAGGAEADSSFRANYVDSRERTYRMQHKPHYATRTKKKFCPVSIFPRRGRRKVV